MSNCICLSSESAPEEGTHQKVSAPTREDCQLPGRKREDENSFKNRAFHFLWCSHLENLKTFDKFNYISIITFCTRFLTEKEMNIYGVLPLCCLT